MTPAQHKPTWRLWLIGSYVLIVGVVAALWAFSLFSPIDRAEEQQQLLSLTSTAQAGRVALENTGLGAQEIIDELVAFSEGGENGSLRATLIDAQGTVLADSSDDAASMENHAERPEMQAALGGSIGHDRRTSASDGTEYLYVAVPATYHGEQAALRVSVPVSDVNSMAQMFRNTGLLLLAVAVALAVLVSWLAFRRAAKPVSRLERMRTDFVANASHEFKTPVTGIRLLSESISQAAADGDLQAVKLFATRLDKESTRLHSLLTDLLDLSRLENGGLAARAHEASDFHGAVSTSYEGHVAQAAAKGVAFTFEDTVPPNERCRVRLSAADATLVADNLVSNALAYTPKGSVTVRLACDEQHVVLTVQDTGIGIAAQDQERVFERFYRADAARSRELGGTGLGLSLVRHAVNRGGGTISLQSSPGAGSTFTVTLPRVRG